MWTGSPAFCRFIFLGLLLFWCASWNGVSRSLSLESHSARATGCCRPWLSQCPGWHLGPHQLHLFAWHWHNSPLGLSKKFYLFWSQRRKVFFIQPTASLLPAAWSLFPRLALSPVSRCPDSLAPPLPALSPSSSCNLLNLLSCRKMSATCMVENGFISKIHT